MSQSWKCNSCSLYNSYTRNNCQACFTKNDQISIQISDHSQVNDDKNNIQNNGYVIPKSRLNAIARVLLMGVYDDDNILSKLRGVRFILKAIWEFAISFNQRIWPKYIECHSDCNYVLKKCPIQFPTPTNININMMPFIRSHEFEETKLPKYLKSYYDSLIKPCLGSTDLDYEAINFCGSIQEIYFLTIQESVVDVGRSQRRPGLHTESPGNTDEGYQIMWGSGGCNYDAYGGIFMASSVDNSCSIWNCKIVGNKYCDDNKQIIGHLGDIEHLRSSLPYHTKEIMEGNCLYWLTDRTPHESLAMNKKTYRQFFRLVTSEVSIWYKQHSTKNPNGVEPDPNITTIIKENKFEK